MDRRQFLQGASLVAVAPALVHDGFAQHAKPETPQWLRDFAEPPDAARPWVYAFWMEGNITKEGIRADLNAMKEQGIGGMLFMDGALNNPSGPERFLSESWIELFVFMVEEANRLGLEINLNNAPGWAGSGGPWITPEYATKRVIVAENVMQGGSPITAPLSKPSGIRHDYYNDIAVLAYPLGDAGLPAFRIPNIGSTKSFAGDEDFFGVVPWPRFIPTNTAWPEPPADQTIPSAKMIDLTEHFDANGTLRWTPPEGRWLLLRIGYTVANGATRSTQPEATGLECDKLSKAAVEMQFHSMVARLSDKVKPLIGKALVSTHIDSWEAGSGNWTSDLREEFHKRCGYDLLPYLPTLSGLVVDSRAVSERFLWDFRETISQLLLENYAGHMHTLAHAKGLRLSIEGYDGTVDDLRYAGRADEPMSEFWRACYSGLPLSDLNESMASAAHVYGRKIVGCESFTSMRGDYADHPATMKPLADWAFCVGINRICFSEWIMQPWPNLKPGVSFSTLGTVFHEDVTWWHASLPWHRYIARCQHMLRQGSPVADICFVAPEGGPYRFTPPVPATQHGGIPDRPSYNFDGCPAELILAAHVENGEIVLPSGMRYRLLVLPTYNANGLPVMRLNDSSDYTYTAEPMPNVRTMTPALLRKVHELVEAGATALGYRALQSPSLANYPQCDAEIQQLADAIWGANAGENGSGGRTMGRGRILWGRLPDEIFAAISVPPDFSSTLGNKLNYTHRRADDGTEIYFVCNKDGVAIEGEVVFRITGRQPMLYWPQNGTSTMVNAYREENGTTRIPLTLAATESVFVIFSQAARTAQITSITADGKPIWPISAPTPQIEPNAFTMAFWATPGPPITLPGAEGYAEPVRQPALGYQIWVSPGEAYYGVAIGHNGLVIYQYSAEGYVQPLLVHAVILPPSTHIGIDYSDRIARLYINGKLTATSKPNPWPERPSPTHRPFAGELAAVNYLDYILQRERPNSEPPHLDLARHLAWSSGAYALRHSDGKSNSYDITLPQSQLITGAWEVAFEPAWGGPAQVTFPTLHDWSTHGDERIRHYSGTATYRKQFSFETPDKMHRKGLRTWLDLGRVAVIADVQLNGKSLGILWNTPYRVDATAALRGGENNLEIRVTNLWTNRLIGDEGLPQDSNRAPDGVIRSWPQWVLDRQKSPTGRYTFGSSRVWEKGSTLLPSGLLGPVQIRYAEELVV